jgi:hypothetical protein
MYNSFELFFFWRIFLLLVGGSKQWFCKNITVKEGLIANSLPSAGKCDRKKQQQG